MTQYYSRVDREFNGGSKIITVPFPYIKREDIEVLIDDNVITEWSWLNDSQITINTELISGNILSICRTTEIDEKIVDYKNMGMVLNEDNLNASQNQLLYLIQELYDNTDITLENNKQESINRQEAFEDEVNTKIQLVSDAAEKINKLEESVEIAVNASENATTKAEEVTQQAEELIDTITSEGEQLITNIIEEVNRVTEQVKNIDKNIDKISSKVSFSMFDTILKDHILTYEESKGLALQGTYVYKDAIAGSRYGYPDFYNKCIEEYDEAVEERWEQPVLTGNTTQVAEGEIVCTASSYYPTENRQPYCAMDGVKSGATTTLGAWSTHNTKTGWWQVKFPYKLKITGLKYYAPCSTTEASYIATTGRFYTSSDKSTPIGDGLSITDNWQIVDIANIPAEGIVTDTIYFDITDSGFYGGIGELEITATRAGIVRNSNGHIFYDIAIKDQIDQIYENTGTAWFYGVDTENERIFLPRDKYFALKGNASVVGNGNILGVTTTGEYGGMYWANNSIGVGSHTVTPIPLPLGQPPTSYGNITLNGTGGYLGVSTDPALSGLEAHIEANEDKYLYICVGNTESKGATTEVIDVTTTENDTTPLFTGLYFDFKPNNVSWLIGGGQANNAGIYAFTYNELVNVLNGETKYGDLKVINEADMIAGVDYSEYWKVNQDEMYFITPTKISNKALSGAVKGNGMTLGLTNGSANFGLSHNISHTFVSNGATYGESVGTAGESYVNASANAEGVGLTTDSIKSGIIAEESTSQLYFKVANAVQNLELLNAGEVLEALADKISRQDCKAYIVETYVNGTSGHNIWSNGYCEQWGLWTYGGASTYNLVFTKQFADTDYQMFFSIQAPAITGAYYSAGIENNTAKTVNGCTIGWRNAGANCYVYWRACGRLAQGQY